MNYFSRTNIRNKLKNMKRADWLVVLLVGVLLLVAALPTDDGRAKKGQAEPEEPEAGSADAVPDGREVYRERLEAELEELLRRMEGVGNVRVMLTLKDTGAQVLDKNVKRGADSSETSTVIYEREKAKEPYVTNRFLPDVEGVFIVAQGGGNAVVVSDISDAVMALFGVEAHKIKIVKMSD